MSRSSARLVGLVLLVALLAACTWPGRPASPTAVPIPPAAAQTPPATALLVPTATPPLMPSKAPLPVPAVGAVVYEQAGNLYLYDGRTLRSLVTDRRAYAPLLSPGGQRVLFRRHEKPTALSSEPFSMALLDLQTGQETAVDLTVLPAQPYEFEGRTLALPRWPLSVAWMPDSQTLLFNTVIDYSMIGPGAGLRDDLWQLDAATGQVRSLFPETSSPGSFTLSPDGRWVLLNRATQIEALELATGKRHTLLEFPSVLTYSDYAWLPEPRWSPDSRVAHVAIAPADPMQTYAYDLYTLDVAAGTAQKLGPVEGAVFAWSPNGRSWSPDGTQLAYVTQVDGQARIAVLALTGIGSAAATLSTGGDSPQVLGWSPDGKTVLVQDGTMLYGISAGPQLQAQRLTEVDSSTVELLWLGNTPLVKTGDGKLLEVALDGSGVNEVP
jgi:Tol biopolymer transport system component